MIDHTSSVRAYFYAGDSDEEVDDLDALVLADDGLLCDPAIRLLDRLSQWVPAHVARGIYRELAAEEGVDNEDGRSYVVIGEDWDLLLSRFYDLVESESRVWQDGELGAWPHRERRRALTLIDLHFGPFELAKVLRWLAGLNPQRPYAEWIKTAPVDI